MFNTCSIQDACYKVNIAIHSMALRRRVPNFDHRPLKVTLRFDDIAREIPPCTFETDTDAGCSTLYSNARRCLALPDRSGLVLSNKHTMFKCLLPQHSPLCQVVPLVPEHSSRFFGDLKKTVIVNVCMSLHGEGKRKSLDDSGSLVCRQCNTAASQLHNNFCAACYDAQPVLPPAGATSLGKD